MFLEAVKAATRDEGFLRLQSPEAITGYSTATTILKWATVNVSLVQHHAEALIMRLKHFLKQQPVTKSLREKVWVNLYQYSTSTEYHQLWNSLTANAQASPSPILYFFITHHILCELLKNEFPLVSVGQSELSTQVNISVDEEAALKYVGGYIVRSLMKKINRKHHSLKAKMILALQSFCENSHHDDSREMDEETVEDLDWVSLCDRGGLYHVRTEFHCFLYSVEMVVKKIISNLREMKTGFTSRLENNVKQDVDVLFWWEILCAVVNVENDAACELLSEVVQHYVVVRGFAFTSKWMEQYKVNNKKNLQKSKGLRKKLLS